MPLKFLTRYSPCSIGYDQRAVVGLISAVFLMFFTTVGRTAELSPYAPPIGQTQQPQMVPATPNKAENEFYQQFAAKAQSLTTAEKQDLVSRFTQERERARRDGQIGAIQHYSLLLNILGAP